MFKAITQFKATGKRGGYTLQWQGANKPSYIIGENNTCCWYKHKKDAVRAEQQQNEASCGRVSRTSKSVWPSTQSQLEREALDG